MRRVGARSLPGPLAVALIALCTPTARLRAEEPMLREERARILAVEMRRGPVADLEPFLVPEAPARLRSAALAALGRLGAEIEGVVPALRRELERPDLPPDLLATALWAAGLARSPELGEAIARHLGAEDGTVGYYATRALGRSPTPDAAARLGAFLDVGDGDARKVGALHGLARLEDKDPGRFAKVLAIATKPGADAAIRRAALFCAWMSAAARRAAAKAAAAEGGAPWEGDEAACETLAPLLELLDSDARLGAVRVIGVLLPPTPFAPDEWRRRIRALLVDPDPRVAQETIARVLLPRHEEMRMTYEVLSAFRSSRSDPKTRVALAEVLGASETDVARNALRERLRIESDPLVRGALAVALARLGDESGTSWLSGRADEPRDEAVGDVTRAQVLLATPREGALAELLAWTDPDVPERRSLHPAVWMTVLGGLEGRQVPGLAAWVSRFLGPAPGVSPEDLPQVRAAAIGLIGQNALLDCAPRLLEALAPAAGPGEDVRTAAAEALGALAGSAVPGDLDDRMRAALRGLAVDPSPWPRRAAREAARKIDLRDVPPVPAGLPETTWRGLPRAREPWPGVDPEGAGEWLTEVEILAIADWLEAEQPLLAFDTTQGTFHVRVEASGVPAHSVSLFNAVRNGLYVNTRWHRVVPSFVIQGGDPRGHGGGGGGWTVPDEITPLPFLRGTLGMPKSTKDDGGCQLFFMHSDYHPLDDRYTAYGQVVSGMEVVDRIQVGDLILRARVLRQE